MATPGEALRQTMETVTEDIKTHVTFQKLQDGDLPVRCFWPLRKILEVAMATQSRGKSLGPDTILDIDTLFHSISIRGYAVK